MLVLGYRDLNINTSSLCSWLFQVLIIVPYTIVIVQNCHKLNFFKNSHEAYTLRVLYIFCMEKLYMVGFFALMGVMSSIQPPRAKYFYKGFYINQSEQENYKLLESKDKEYIKQVIL